MLILINDSLHIFDFLRYISFLPTLLLNIHLVLLYQSLFLSNYYIFLLNDTIKPVFVSPQSFDMFVFITDGHLALKLVSFKGIKFFF